MLAGREDPGVSHTGSCCLVAHMLARKHNLNCKLIDKGNSANLGVWAHGQDKLGRSHILFQTLI